MDQLDSTRDRTNPKREPWFGDLIAAYEEKFPADGDRQVNRQMVWVASLIIVLYFGWSLLLVTLVCICWLVWSPSGWPLGMLFGLPLGPICLAFGWILFVYLIFKAWWKNFHDIDEENAVSRSDAPVLFQLIDEVCLKLGEGKVDKVIIGEGHGAWAVFGRYRHWYGGGREKHIKLGVLTLSSLSEQEIKATIAHEAHHLFGDNQTGVALGYFAYSLAWNARWSPLGLPVRTMIRPLERHLLALMFVRSRQCEKAADAFETEVCEPRTCAISLLRLYAFETEYLKAGPETQPGFWLQDECDVKNTYRLYDGFIQKLYQEDRSKLERRMKKQLKAIVAIDDIHPSLRNRVESVLGTQSEQELDQLVADALQPVNDKARQLLGGCLPGIVDELYEKQWKSSESTWKAYNAHYLRLKKRLVPVDDVKTVQHAMDHYKVTTANSGEAIARPWLEKAIQFTPKDSRAQYLLARYDLEHGDAQLQTVAAQSLHALADGPSCVAAEQSLEDLSYYYRAIGDHQRLEQVGRQKSQLEARQQKLHFEKQPTRFGSYSSVPLDGSVSFDKCVKLEKQEPAVAAIYVARKRLSQCSETKYFVFALRFHPFKKLTEASRRKVMDSYLKQIDADMKIQRVTFHVVDRSSLTGLKVRWYGTRLDA